MSEKFALRQLGIDRAAIRGDERAVSSLGVQFVNSVGDQFFAGSGLTADKDGKVAQAAHARDPAKDRNHPRAHADDSQRLHLLLDSFFFELAFGLTLPNPGERLL
jgi:hypothetical protein